MTTGDSLPIPVQGESQSDYAIRFHNEARNAILETDRRTERCFELWNQHAGNTHADNRAMKRFGTDEYSLVRNVPVFAEHTTKDREGNLVVYDRNALQAIMDRCNHRIEDTDDFAPITEGHTPDADAIAQGAPMPEVLGYAGPYRLGMIGNKDPRWAIFAHEWHHKEDVPKLKRMRRRSPEVWLEGRMEDRFFDPIAALGAQTPRLDMGMTAYHRNRNGDLVEKYAAAAVAPSANSTFVPSFGDDKKSNYRSESNMLQQEDIQAVVDALLQTDQMQWVSQQMTNDSPMPTNEMGEEEIADEIAPVESEEADFPDEETGLEEEMAETEEYSSPAAIVPPDDQGSKNYCCDDDDKSAMSKYMSGEMSEDDMQAYMAAKKGRYMAEATAEGSGSETPVKDSTVDEATSKYSRVRAENRELYRRYKRLEKDQEQLKKRVLQAEREKQTADRYSKLSEYRREFAFDLTKESKRCARMSEDQFQNHLDCISENYQKIPLAEQMPIAPTPSIHVARTEATGPSSDHVARAKKYCLAERNKGNEVSWAEALDHTGEDK